MTNELQSYVYFPTIIYTLDNSDFLASTRSVLAKSFSALGKNVKLSVPTMTNNLINEPEILDFLKFSSATGWNILNAQGYKMDDKLVVYESVWGQQYTRKSQMEQHVHSNGVQLCGFYFVDVPKDSPKIVIHDPRAGKNQINMPESQVEAVTAASSMINFTPKEGMFLFSNAWLPHSFTRHESTKPFTFIHFNLTVIYSPEQHAMPVAEVI